MSTFIDTTQYLKFINSWGLAFKNSQYIYAHVCAIIEFLLKWNNLCKEQIVSDVGNIGRLSYLVLFIWNGQKAVNSNAFTKAFIPFDLFQFAWRLIFYSEVCSIL